MHKRRWAAPVVAVIALASAAALPNATARSYNIGIPGGALFQHEGEAGGSAANPATGGTIASPQAIAARNALVKATASSPLSAAAWKQYGASPMRTDPAYQGTGAFPTLSGRITDLVTDPTGTRLFAGVGLSGIYESRDKGSSWRLITSGVPNPTNGAVGFTPANGGTVIDATGDYDGGFIGQGVWWSGNDGRTWHKSTGVPDRLLSSKVAVDPTNPRIVYVGTSRGLWRSTDAGHSFVNVHLPVGPTRTGGVNCSNDQTHPECALAEWVSDVIVRPADSKDPGGEVIAAVGWERGVHATAKGWNNALGNGLYMSPTGRPDSFTNLDASAHGFTPQSHIGRVALGNAIGPMQDHNVMWAIVEDAQKENGGYPVVDPNPDVPAACGLAPCYTTNLDNIYESTDFGKTWAAKLPPAETFGVACGVSGTDLCGLIAAPVVSGYAPGVQARYNLYLRLDPTRQDASGMPTRIVFGLEELWQIDLTDPTNTTPTGLVVPHTIGRYFGGQFCPETQAPAVTTPNPPACPGQDEAPTTTHPDQHRGVFVPDGKGGVTLYAGGDGGVYSQHVAQSAAFSNTGWGQGNNAGLPTLLQYHLAVSGDGTVVSGLQDNGEERILPNGKEVEIFGGDAFFSAIHPTNSKIIYEEYTTGNMNVTTDGGLTWASMNPVLTGAQFSTPFTMDPTDANHLMTGGEDIEETTSGPNTTTSPIAQQTSGLDADGLPSPTASTDWKVVYDLGSGNAATAIATRGKASYVGFCGPCYIPSTVSQNFAGGLATNVGGSAAGAEKSTSGWHTAAAKGLPQRYITSVAVDPNDTKTVYVTLTDYDPSVEYRYPGALGDAAAHLGHGHVFVSHNAGASFTDISGNLPNTTAGWVLVRGKSLIVATNVGVFSSSTRAGRTWVPLGGGSLPITHETALQLQPNNPNRLFLSTYGRGTYVYDFPAGARISGSGSGTGATGSGGGTLSKTGSSPVLAWLALVLMTTGLGLAVARRRRRMQGG